MLKLPPACCAMLPPSSAPSASRTKTLHDQMMENADVFEQVAALVETDPTGQLEDPSA
jgi:hypothetical protein